MVTVGNLDGAFKAVRYIQVPGYGSAGHRTIAHLYKSLLHGAGLPQDTFGQLDLSMPSSISQSGPSRNGWLESPGAYLKIQAPKASS